MAWPRASYSVCWHPVCKSLAPGMPYAHPTVEHFAPIFITLGAATQADVAPETVIDGYWMGLAKRSFQVA